MEADDVGREIGDVAVKQSKHRELQPGADHTEKAVEDEMPVLPIDLLDDHFSSLLGGKNTKKIKLLRVF